MEEIIKAIPKHDGYFISNLGKIYSDKRKSGRKELKPFANAKGYAYVDLGGKKYSVHRLVALTFIPNPQNLPQINHKDENKWNNHVNNLEWCTNEYNHNYGTRNKKMAITESKPLLMISAETGIIVKRYQTEREAEKDGHYHGSILKAIRKEISEYHGFRWEWEKDYEKSI